VQGNRTGTARRGILNQTAHTLHLEGDVLLTEGETSIRGSVIDYNLQTKDMSATGVPIVIKQPVPAQNPGPPATPKPKKKK
jgi:lipopolysaccharide export system protein LptA